MKNKYATMILAVLIFIAAGVNSALAQENKIYEINLNYDKGNILLMSEIVVRTGYAPDRKIQPKIGYKSEVLSLTDDILYSFKFEIPNVQCSDSVDPETNQMSGGCVSLDQTSFTLAIPYFENGKIINIYNPDGKKVFFASVEHLAKALCGDYICQKSESYKACPQDCLLPKEKESVSVKTIAGIAGFIIAVIIAAIFIFKKIKNKNIEQ